MSSARTEVEMALSMNSVAPKAVRLGISYSKKMVHFMKSIGGEDSESRGTNLEESFETLGSYKASIDAVADEAAETDSAEVVKIEVADMPARRGVIRSRNYAKVKLTYEGGENAG